MNTENEKRIWTIGHSTRTISDFLELLNEFGIEMVDDIRSFPGSRRFPQFNCENLAASLAQDRILYRHPQLGGRRRVLPGSLNSAWRHPAFRGYADYMETDTFKEGIEIVGESAIRQKSVLMCSEAVWWRCHRGLVSDYLKFTGWEVWHIFGKNKVQEHPYTSAARFTDGQLNYHLE